ncbi:MAG: sigma-70 family RNA polymerase sigma factor [Lachnospiraceae bacterium]|nr:sigma-70 family RNA polymerase sigma factor [Lachnospiraceae bacterium]
MEDRIIIKLFFERSEEAVKALEEKYGALCKYVANKIVNNEQDALECVNDTMLAVWNRIPPENPEPLVAYVCRIAKNNALKKYEYSNAAKRKSSYDIALEELEQTLCSDNTVEDEVLIHELTETINTFLGEQKELDRIFFVKRYWFSESVSDIALQSGKSTNYVTVHLHRMRTKLKKYLRMRGLM